MIWSSRPAVAHHCSIRIARYLPSRQLWSGQVRWWTIQRNAAENRWWTRLGGSISTSNKQVRREWERVAVYKPGRRFCPLRPRFTESSITWYYSTPDCGRGTAGKTSERGTRDLMRTGWASICGIILQTPIEKGIFGRWFVLLVAATTVLGNSLITIRMACCEVGRDDGQ